MGTYRMFTDPQGKASWEGIDLTEHPEWKSGFDTNKITFGTRAPGVASDWHPAPRRQFIIILSGQLEIGFEDGTKRVFGAGDARLMEDITGKGHTTTTVGSEPCITATISLRDQG